MSYSRSLITVKQAAEILGLSPKTVYAGKAGTEKLRKVRNGNRAVRMIRQEVEAHLNKLLAGDKVMAEIIGCSTQIVLREFKEFRENSQPRQGESTRDIHRSAWHGG